MKNFPISPEHLRTLFDKSTKQENFLREIEQLIRVKIVWGRIGQITSKYSPVKNKILLDFRLKTARKVEFLCTVAHELNHVMHRRRSLIMLASIILIGGIALILAVYNPHIISLILVMLIVCSFAITRFLSMWQLQAEAFAAATIGLETHKMLQRFKKKPPPRWRRVIINAFLPEML